MRISDWSSDVCSSDLVDFVRFYALASWQTRLACGRRPPKQAWCANRAPYALAALFHARIPRRRAVTVRQPSVALRVVDRVEKNQYCAWRYAPGNVESQSNHGFFRRKIGRANV